MNFSKIFIDRPIATAAIMAALFLTGILAFTRLSAATITRIDFPTISVSAALPGADPETMASSVAAPLERQFARIPSLTQLTSTSILGSTSISLQFDLGRDVDAAAQDVAAAINAAAGQLPKDLPNPPVYRKANPSDLPVMNIGLYSEVLPLDVVNEYADVRIVQKLSQLPGVAQVSIVGEQRKAVRVQINPTAIANLGISLEDVRTAITRASVNSPKGSLNGPHLATAISSNDQLTKAADYAQIVVAYRKGAPIHISDIGTAIDSVENSRISGWVDQHHGLYLAVVKLPDADVTKINDRVKEEMPKVIATMPPAIHTEIISDYTQVIRASLKSIEEALIVAVIAVMLVIFLFLRKIWSTIIPGIAVPLSLVGTFGVMYLFGFTLDNLSLMALTIAVGFVVDDAIVMIENIIRHLEQGESPYEAAIKGAAQVGVTIVTMSVSLIAVFIPLLLMQGIVGRLFYEFAITVSVAVLISAFVSLTLTPMMCARFLDHREGTSRFHRVMEHFFEGLVNGYARGLRVVLRHQPVVLASLLATVALTGVLYVSIPKGFFPQQDTGVMIASTQADQNISFEQMNLKQQQMIDVASKDPAVLHVVAASGIGSNGGNTGNTGRNALILKPFSQRTATADEVIARLRPQFAKIEGLQVFMLSMQDINVGARQARTQYQYTLQDQDIDELSYWSNIMYDKLKTIPQLQDVATDLQNSASRTVVKVDRETASRLGVDPSMVDQILYDAFGQRQVSTIYTQLNQYKVVLEVDPKFGVSVQSLNSIFVPSVNGKQVPLSAFSTIETTNAALSVSHQGQFPAVTLSFNLRPGVALGEAVDAIDKVQTEMRMPISVVPTFQGTAQSFQASLVTMPYLIAAALIVVYLVLAILYESFIHPLTILSTIPSAGVGALLMLWLFGYPLDMMGLIGIILLIGIVKKNAIMMIDFAIEGERTQGMSPEDAIYHAALLRFRPILMTTMAAIVSGLPLMLGTGAGSEFRQPLGLAVVGGLMVSQVLTLFTTPVVYLYLGRLDERIKGARKTRPQAELVPLRKL